MKKSLLLLAFATLVGTAHAADAFSNLAFPIVGGNYVLGDVYQQKIGYRFTSSLTGALTGFNVAIGNTWGDRSPRPFTLSLYSNGASDTLGTLFGTFSGLSTGEYPATNAVATVAATGPSLSSGSQYWLVVSTDSSSALTWNIANGASDLPGYSSNIFGTSYGSFPPGAFSVQVNPVPEPATVIALGAGALALVRRKMRK